MLSPDANVRAYLQREDELQRAKAYCAETAFVARNAEFASTGLLKANGANRARQAKNQQQEMAALDEEVVLTRRARLQAFYRDQEMAYQKELVEMGLSLKW